MQAWVDYNFNVNRENQEVVLLGIVYKEIVTTEEERSKLSSEELAKFDAQDGKRWDMVESWIAGMRKDLEESGGSLEKVMMLDKERVRCDIFFCGICREEEHWGKMVETGLLCITMFEKLIDGGGGFEDECKAVEVTGEGGLYTGRVRNLEKVECPVVASA